tara:strand:- start:1042 stop:1419 length:378 start_codon:yes stop_codon:yes gene_type:complete
MELKICEDVSNFLETLNRLKSKFFRILPLSENYLIVVYVEFDSNLVPRLSHSILNSAFIESSLDSLDSNELSKYSQVLSKLERYSTSGIFEVESDSILEAKFKMWYKRATIDERQLFVDASGNIL